MLVHRLLLACKRSNKKFKGRARKVMFCQAFSFTIVTGKCIFTDIIQSGNEIANEVPVFLTFCASNELFACYVTGKWGLSQQ